MKSTGHRIEWEEYVSSDIRSKDQNSVFSQPQLGTLIIFQGPRRSSSRLGPGSLCNQLAMSAR